MEINVIDWRIELVNEAKTFFKKGKIDTPSARLKKNWNEIKNGKGDIAIDITYIQRLLLTIICQEVEKMDKFLEIYELPRLNYDKMEFEKTY